MPIARASHNRAADAGDPALDGAWRWLEGAAVLPTQTRSFHNALAATFLVGTPVAMFMARQGETAEALLPLVHSPGLLARWRLAGAREVYEPGDALLASPGAADSLARELAQQSRPIVLDRIPADSPLIPALRQAMRGRGLCVVRQAEACPTIALDATWSDPATRFNAGRRSDFRRALRKAEECGAVSFEVSCPALSDFDERFDEAIAVEISSWKRAAGTAIASDPAKEAFFRTYLRSECESGALRIAFMRIDGRPVAMQLGVVLGGRFWLYKIGYDEAYRKCSPGTLLMLHCIGEAARTGLNAFELLGNAEPWIAELWTETAMPCLSLRTYPVSLAGAAALATDGLAWLRQRLKGRG
ncbi:MAG TPA: GNAT family N-acetyltransferase [Novosphingobium sp.]|nr:GNAT family N-acetyltransferase [Novosphingobium sp.]HQA18375.1 GNAT family N-acetyltransferase [Novosphingobium sp.]